MASTYVNDLRLNEMATGDASGSWGTVTNTNLELIGEAFSYGTETIGDADSTLTIADGAADAARSFYLKITSSVDLTTTRIVTLAPNTVSKVWMIENATTGSQVITIKQGSGATINVPNGQVKMISTDGAGSGGAVLDLLVDVDLTGTTTLVNLDVSGTLGVTGVLTATSLDISGDIDVDGTTNLDVVDIDGAVDMASTLLVTGVLTTTAATVSNGGGQFNGAINVGVDDTGYDVKFFGATAGAYMLWDESADDLILGGAAGLSVNSTALVTGVLTTTAATVHTGGITMPDNAKAIFGAGSDLQIYHDGSNSYITDTGTGNLIIGADDFRVTNPAITETMISADTDGVVKLYHDNAVKLATTATGIDVTGTVTADGLTTNTAGTSNFIAGVNAGNSILSGGNYNTVVGDEAGTAISTGGVNVAVGFKALFEANSGSNNVALGSNAMRDLTTGTFNIAIGSSAMYDGIVTGNHNTAIGYLALENLTGGINNIAIGSQALEAVTVGDNALAIGYQALEANGASEVLGIGTEAGQNSTGAEQVFVGYNSGRFVTSGTSQTFVGHAAGKGITGAKLTGANNTAIGKSAGLALQGSAAGNTFLGKGAGQNVTTGDSNIIIGSGIDAASATADNQLNIGGWITGDAGDISFAKTLTLSTGNSATNGVTALEIFASANETYNTFGSMYSSGATMIGRGVEPKAGGVGYVASITANTTRAAIEVGANTIVFSGSAAVNTTRGDAVTMTDRMTIETNGDVTIETGNLVVGTAGKGIDFSAVTGGTGTATGNVLDDYEEGTWTPVLTDTTNNATMGASNSGTYTKIGRFVTCQMYVETTSLGSVTSAVYITGWPFTITESGGGSLSAASGLNITAGRVVVLRPWSAALMRIEQWSATTGTDSFTASNWSADGAAYISVTYITA
jgi:hypothetical protein